MGLKIPRSAIMITRSRKLSLKLVYQLTHQTMICRSKCRPLNRSSIGTNRCISSSLPATLAFAPEPFYNPETGGQWKDLWHGLKKACRKAGLKDVTWHTFRHTFASRLTRNGADLVTVKELLGHSSVSVTMRYAHTNRDAKRRAVGLIAGNGAKLVTLPIAR